MDPEAVGFEVCAAAGSWLLRVVGPSQAPSALPPEVSPPGAAPQRSAFQRLLGYSPALISGMRFTAAVIISKGERFAFPARLAVASLGECCRGKVNTI